MATPKYFKSEFPSREDGKNTSSLGTSKTISLSLILEGQTSRCKLFAARYEKLIGQMTCYVLVRILAY